MRDRKHPSLDGGDISILPYKENFADETQFWSGRLPVGDEDNIIHQVDLELQNVYERHFLLCGFA